MVRREEDERPLVVTALIAAYNEADVIGQVIADLIDQDVRVYLIDHGSEDDTVEQATPFLGRGLLAIERFPEESGFPPEDRGRFAWRHVLERKEQLAAQLDSDWFIHHDADELRESPWADAKLRDAIARVDRLGYSAIDFAAFNFPPTHDGFERGQDLRSFFSQYEPGAAFDKLQIKCWKKQPAPIDLASSGGHQAQFAGRRVFPLRFVLRHYPVRSQAHGERKVFRDRKPRFVSEERASGWHVQYDAMSPGTRFLRDPASLLPFDLETVRVGLSLSLRPDEELLGQLADQEKRFTTLLDTLHLEQRHAVELRQEFAELQASQQRAEEWARHLQEEASQRAARDLEESRARAGELERALASERAHREALAQSAHELEAAQQRSEVARAHYQGAAEQAIAELEVLRPGHRELSLELERVRGQLEQASSHRESALDEHRRAGVELEQARRELAQAHAVGRELAKAQEVLHELAAARAKAEELLEVGRQEAAASARGEAERVVEAARAEQRRAEEGRAELAAQLAASQVELATAQRELSNALETLARADARIDELYSSKSWRLSAALREAWRLMGRQ